MQNKTIFLADNVKMDRYAYLLIVYTGWQRFSGTTANITVQLRGTKAISKVSLLRPLTPQHISKKKQNKIINIGISSVTKRGRGIRRVRTPDLWKY